MNKDMVECMDYLMGSIVYDMREALKNMANAYVVIDEKFLKDGEKYHLEAYDDEDEPYEPDLFKCFPERIDELIVKFGEVEQEAKRLKDLVIQNEDILKATE